jgi:hypothetical protein
MTPDCMDARELAEWHDANRRVTGGAHAIAPCADCPAWFRAEATAEGRCNGPIRRHEPKHDERRRAQWREAQARKAADGGVPRRAGLGGDRPPARHP